MAAMLGILSTTDHHAIVSNMMPPPARKDGLERFVTKDEPWQIDIELTLGLSLATSRPVSKLRELFLPAARQTDTGASGSLHPPGAPTLKTMFVLPDERSKPPCRYRPKTANRQRAPFPPGNLI